MRPLEVLIVDDEPIARDILEGYVYQLPGLHLAGKCKSAFEAQAALGSTPIDVMLLDINMPLINGMDFLKSIKHPPAVIFTTAYAEYAVQSYELNAVDYLLKPIAFERFFAAITKVMNQHRVAPASQVPEPANNAVENVMFVKANGKLVKIDLGKLWLVEGLKDYLKLYVGDEKLVVYSTMKNMEEQLAFLPNFVRVSKSNIVNIRYINEIEGNAIRMNGHDVVIGPTYKDKVGQILSSYKML
jgi:DNA-binding LytR/AlgR family response regulator